MSRRKKSRTANIHVDFFIFRGARERVKISRYLKRSASGTPRKVLTHALTRVNKVLPESPRSALLSPVALSLFLRLSLLRPADRRICRTDIARDEAGPRVVIFKSFLPSSPLSQVSSAWWYTYHYLSMSLSDRFRDIRIPRWVVAAVPARLSPAQKKRHVCTCFSVRSSPGSLSRELSDLQKTPACVEYK